MRRLVILILEPKPQFTLWNVGPQQVHLAFDGGLPAGAT
jgi:hypothetical protein